MWFGKASLSSESHELALELASEPLPMSLFLASPSDNCGSGFAEGDDCDVITDDLISGAAASSSFPSDPGELITSSSEDASSDDISPKTTGLSNDFAFWDIKIGANDRESEEALSDALRCRVAASGLLRG